MKTSKILLFMSIAMTYAEVAFSTAYGGIIMVVATLFAATVAGSNGD